MNTLNWNFHHHAHLYRYLLLIYSLFHRVASNIAASHLWQYHLRNYGLEPGNSHRSFTRIRQRVGPYYIGTQTLKWFLFYFYFFQIHQSLNRTIRLNHRLNYYCCVTHRWCGKSRAPLHSSIIQLSSCCCCCCRLLYSTMTFRVYH